MLYTLFDQTRGWLSDHNLYWAFSLLDQIHFRALAAAGLSFLIVILLGPRTIRTLRRLKIGDSGETDSDALRSAARSKAQTPTMGGVLIAGAIAGSVLLLADITQFYVQAALLVLVWMASLGGADDYLKLTASRRGKSGGGGRQGLYAWEKLVFQLGIGLLIGVFAYSHAQTGSTSDLGHVLNLPFQKTFLPATAEVNPGLLYLPRWAFIGFAVVMIAGMSNAVNITDGMDGLAAGTTSAVSFGLMILALIAGREAAAQYLLVPYIPAADELGVLAGAMLGACMGFLWWNCSPAAVFMGDTGSLCLGGLIGYIAVIIRQEFVILLMCGVFLAEIGSVVAQVGYFKASGGKRIFRCAPYHHHLHLGGWTEQQVVARMWIVTLLLMIVALASVKVR